MIQRSTSRVSRDQKDHREDQPYNPHSAKDQEKYHERLTHQDSSTKDNPQGDLDLTSRSPLGCQTEKQDLLTPKQHTST